MNFSLKGEGQAFFVNGGDHIPIITVSDAVNWVLGNRFYWRLSRWAPVSCFFAERKEDN